MIRPRVKVALATAGMALLGGPAAGAAPAGGVSLGESLPAWSVIPFAGILLSIALFPLFAPHFWHRRYPQVALVWGAIFAVPFVWIFRGQALHEIAHAALLEYFPFVILLTALFTIGGGIYVRGSFAGTPASNTAILAVGTAIASFIGTTGASVLLIRPLLRANAERRHRVHTVVFFIFLVSNIGGCLTPLGDPPLFLGFLQGVPFFWTFSLYRELFFASGILLAVYFIWDTCLLRRERRRARAGVAGEEEGEPSPAVPRESLRLDGGHNLIYLAGVLAAVVLSGIWHPGTVTLFGIPLRIENLVRDAALLVFLGMSWRSTPKKVRQDNGYTWEPMREVAILFAAIFLTIIPALAILKAGERGALAGLIQGVQTPSDFFWATGILSSFLDNAPTYLTFLSTALGRFYPGMPNHEAVLHLIREHAAILQAISLGAVFMGANTYIGNAPNFMVKSIAEEGGVEMPSFFGFLFRYSLPVLFPVFLLISWLVF
jgi:Na+/H+ antiporter NhaD/arsenite permease-like protein